MRGLGEYGVFKEWTGRPRTWGPQDASCRVWFGGAVVDGLCSVLDEVIGSGQQGLAAIGCVPWLTSAAIVDRLLQLTGCCIAIDKGAKPPLRLVQDGNPFPNVLPELRWTLPGDGGRPTMLGPYSPLPQHDLGPVRLVGWNGNRPRKPLLHAKLLVLGVLDMEQCGPDDGMYVEELRFTPESVWCGSANWTDAARSHLEVGFWIDDRTLAAQAAGFVGEVLAFSEPVGSTCARPEPNLVRVEFDDVAMAEAALEQWLLHQADDEGEW
jgi:hypothetical protein